MKLKLLTLLTSITFIITTENHSYAFTRNCDSLNTVYNSTGDVKNGIMFNVIADSSVTLTHLAANLNDGTAKLKIFYRLGSFIGYEQQSSAWTLIDSANVLSNNTLTSTDIPTVVPINFNINMAAGDTIAFYLECPQLSFVYLTPTATPWGTIYSYDSNIKITVARSVYQEFGVPYSTPHIWNGSVSYCTAQSVGINNIKSDNNFKVFQSDDRLNVVLDESYDANSKMKLSLFNLVGENIADFPVNSNSGSYDINSLPEGIYICALYKNNVQVGLKKISIHKQ